MAIRWGDLDFDDRDDEDDMLAAWAAGFDTPTLTERLDAWRPAWMARGACKGLDVSVFFPGRDPADAADAKRVCAGCGVRPECLSFAVDHYEHGVWGGTSPAERRARRKAG